jgi:hypothetical protein
MRTKSILLILLIGYLCSCHQSIDNEDSVKQALNSYFDGIKNKDIQKMNDVTTKDFILFEDGKVWNNDSLFNRITTLPKFTANYRLEFVKINAEEKIAHIIYFNEADFIMSDTLKMTKNWIESAAFKKLDGQWKMYFLHSSVRSK